MELEASRATLNPSRLSQWFDGFQRRIRHGRLNRAWLFLLLMWSSTAAVVAFAEKIPFIDAGWWVIVTMTTVGYGGIIPSTLLGRAVAVLVMVVGVTLFATASGAISARLGELQRRENMGLNGFNGIGHTVICGWNDRAKFALEAIRHEDGGKDKMIVLIATTDEKPVDDPKVVFIHGQVFDETMKLANVGRAKRVIFFGDDSLDPVVRDAGVVAAVLTVEHMNPDAYTVAELVVPAHEETCRRAQDDEVIVTSRVIGRTMTCIS